MSALVVVLQEPGLEAEVRAALARDPAFAPGDCEAGGRLPIVLSTEDGRAAEERTRWLGGVPGVGSVEVVFVGLDEPGAAREPVAPGGLESDR